MMDDDLQPLLDQTDCSENGPANKQMFAIRPTPILNRTGRITGFSLPPLQRLSKKGNWVRIQAPDESDMVFALYLERNGEEDGKKCTDPGPFESSAVHLPKGKCCRYHNVKGRPGQTFTCLAYLVDFDMVAGAEGGRTHTPGSPRTTHPKILIAV